MPHCRNQPRRLANGQQRAQRQLAEHRHYARIWNYWSQNIGKSDQTVKQSRADSLDTGILYCHNAWITRNMDDVTPLPPLPSGLLVAGRSSQSRPDHAPATVKRAYAVSSLRCAQFTSRVVRSPLRAWRHHGLAKSAEDGLKNDRTLGIEFFASVGSGAASRGSGTC